MRNQASVSVCLILSGVTITLDDEKMEYALAVASILHDIGKVAQRFTPGKTHAYLGQMFVNDLPNLNGDFKSLILKLVGDHHVHNLEESTLEPQYRELLQILQYADRKSASHDREDLDPKEFREDPKMHNIYEYVTFSNDPPKKYGKSFDLIKLESSVEIRENEDPLVFNDITYNEIHKNLKDEISKISTRDPKQFFDALDSVLKNYLTFVPSAFYYSEPNITLYDHLRLTAALATSEYRARKAGGDKNLLFIMGDASGIQKYIFNYMVSESADDKATKRLRGRSFVVRLVTDSIVSLIMQRLSLYRYNVIWEKSDGFLIVTNASPENKEKLSHIREEVEEGLIEFNRGLSFALAWTDMPIDSIDDMTKDSFRGVLNSLAAEISTRKKKILDNLMKSKWQSIGVVDNGPGKICRFCGLFHVEEDNRCRACKVEEDIGEALVKTGKVYKRYDSKGILKFRYGTFNISYDFSDVYEDGSCETLLVNNFDLAQQKGVIRQENGATRTILQGNYSPAENNRIITLNKMLCKEDRSVGRCLYLGLAKIDVDNMGLMVTEGIDRLTLSKYASLSGLTSIFFSTIVNSIAKKYNVYIIYAGGDDLTAMGEATSMMKFSMAVRNAFSQWVRNKEITLSTGMALTDHSFPVRRGMEIASENLERVKKTDRKNGLGIFDLVIPWERVKDLNDLSDEIVKLVSNDSGRDSMLGREFPMILISLDKENPYREGIFDKTGKGDRKVKVRIPDSYIFYYLKRNLAIKDENKVRDLTNRISRKEVFSYIRFVAYNAIVNLRRNENGK